MIKPLKEFLPEGQTITAPTFKALMHPGGVLFPDDHCRALFYYYTMASRVYETRVKKPALKYEGDKDSEFDFYNLMKAAAQLYDVDPNKLINWWDLIDKQITLLGMPLLPNEHKYRFNSVLILPSRLH